jgi:TPP-dependent indolepyruvate ferredoxin oxidoreductase alpha subunit
MNIEILDGLSIKDTKNMPSAIQLSQWEYKYYIDEEKGIFKVYRCKDCKEIKKCTDIFVLKEKDDNNYNKFICIPCNIRRDNKIKSDFYKKHEE